MIELTLLGLHAARSSDGREFDSLPAQPKRFALLAYLAISGAAGGGGGYHRRDSLAAMFWPELDQFAARRALRNTLYHLREALGDGVIIARGNDAVSIDPVLVTCDVTRLSDAVEAGRYEEAVDCYRGELLAGVHVPAAGEAFEEWLLLERKRITALVRRALLALSEREDQAENVSAAAYWAQRACALAPDDEGLLRRTMSLLASASDTGGALREYDSYARHVAAEFDAKPSVETEALATRIRNGALKARAPREEEEKGLIAAARADGVELRQTPARGSGWTRRIVGWAAAVLVAGTIGVVAVRSMRAARPASGATKARVLVAVFENRTDDSELLPLGRMTQDWLTQGILSAHLAEVVDQRAVFVQERAAAGATVDAITIAHRTGAGMVVSGSYYRTGDTLLFQANVMNVKTGRIVSAVGPIRSRVGAPVAALDELRSRVLTALASAVDVRASQGLETTVELPPFDVYRDYVDAWDAYWHGDSPRAEALFLRAAHGDSAFAPAALGAATVAANTNNCPLVDSLTHALTARSPAIDRGDRLTLAIADARCRGRNEEMLRLTLERADRQPGDAGAQLSAAAAAQWANRPKRALELLDRVDPKVDLAWMTDTTHFAYWSSATEALHLLGRHREELADADRLSSGAPLGRVWLRGTAMAALSQPTAALALIDSSLALPVETTIDIGLAPYTDGRPAYTATPAWVATWISRELAVHGDPVAARQAAMRAVAWYRSRPADERATPEERFTASGSLEMLGAYAEAEEMVRGLAAEDSTNVDFRGELGGLAAERGDTALADSVDRWLAAQPVARVSWSASVYRARIAALLGRGDDAVARVREALDEGAWPAWFHQEPGIMKLRTRGDMAGLLAAKG